MLTLLTDLKAEPKTANYPFAEGTGVVAAVHYETSPGAFVHFLLTQHGLLIKQGDIKVGVPIHDLMLLAERHDPRFGVKVMDPASAITPAPGSHDDHFRNK